MKRWLLLGVLALAATALLGGSSLAQRYDYGGGGYSSGTSGYLIQFEGGLASPRNTDNVVAAIGPNVVIPDWGEEFAGRLGFGYRFGGGSRVMVSFWSTEADQSESGLASYNFPIGPISGFEFSVTTEVAASTVDVDWAFLHDVNESLAMEWSVGLRHASYEETTDGFYGTTFGTLGVDKLNEGTMLGARVAGRATYRVRRFSGSAGVGLSMLDGEVEARSSLTPQPSGTLPLSLTDDSRSGTILDLDVRAAWHHSGDDLSIWIGWETQEWEDIAADLARNLPGTGVIVRERDSVSFSWFKVGVSYLF